MLPELQYISQGETPRKHLENIKAMLDAGVKLVQLRLKNADERTYTETGSEAKELCRQHEAILIINDNPFVAAGCGAEALHLGLSDMAIEEARRIVPGKIIGGTANTIEHIRQRCFEKVNYIGLGPFRYTTTKEKLSPILGLQGYRNIIGQMKKENLSTPVYAIGGIELHDIREIMETGVHGVAVSGMLTNAANKTNSVKEIKTLISHVKNSR